MQIKLKICVECTILKHIWKRDKGLGYCKSCWVKHKKVKSDIKFKKAIKVLVDQQPKKRISFKSDKRIIQDKQYSKLRKKLIEEHPLCQANIKDVCSGAATQCHHKKGRVGKLYINPEFFLAVCHQCHLYIEMNPEWAKEQGFSLNRL